MRRQPRQNKVKKVRRKLLTSLAGLGKEEEMLCRRLLKQ